jgi:hypothetical protein
MLNLLDGQFEPEGNAFAGVSGCGSLGYRGSNRKPPLVRISAHDLNIGLKAFSGHNSVNVT